MKISEYHERTRDTATYPPGITYPLLGLLGEIGELSGQVAKSQRDDNGELTPERLLNLTKELGDVLYMCAALAHETGTTLDQAIRCEDFETLGQRIVVHSSSGPILANMIDDTWRIMRAAGEASWDKQFQRNRVGEVRCAIEKVVDSVADFAFHYGIDIGMAAALNIEKLADRKRRGVIAGSGDNR